MREHVIKLGGERFLDYNNGYVYDKAGNQIEKWEPKDSTTRERVELQACADVANVGSRRLMRESYYSGYGQQVQQQILMMDAQKAREEVIKMDLGQSDVHLPAAMGNFAGGYHNETPMADMAAPPLMAKNFSDKYFVFDKNDAFQLAVPQVGAGGANVPEVPPRLANFTYTCQEYALGGFVPTQVQASQDAPLQIKQATAIRVMNALLMQRELRVASLLQTSANWNAQQVTTLASGAQWGSAVGSALGAGASSDPVADIHNAMEASLGRVTGMILSERAFHALQRNPTVQSKIAYKDSVAPLPTADTIAAILTLPRIYVASMKYLDTTGAYSYIWGNHVVFIRQPAQMPPTTQNDVATAYTFRWNFSNGSIPDGTYSGGFLVREFYNQVRGSAGGSQLVMMLHDDEVMTSKYVGGLLLNALR